MNSREMIKKITKCLSGKKEILLVYLFGSAVRNPKDAEDLDIAVLVNEEALRKRGSLDYQICLEMEIHNLLKKESGGLRADIVVLNDAGFLFKHEVIKYGKLLYLRDKEISCEFEASAELKYYDFHPYRKIFWQALMKRLKEDKFGKECKITLD